MRSAFYINFSHTGRLDPQESTLFYITLVFVLGHDLQGNTSVFCFLRDFKEFGSKGTITVSLKKSNTQNNPYVGGLGSQCKNSPDLLFL